MKVVVIGYPVFLKFSVRNKLPEFKYNCRTRTAILRRQLKAKQSEFKSHHAISDFIVEAAIALDGKEHWYVGS